MTSMMILMFALLGSMVPPPVNPPGKITTGPFYFMPTPIYVPTPPVPVQPAPKPH